MSYSFFSRTKVLSVCVCIFVLVLIGKLFLLQIVHRNYYSEQADHQYATPASDIFERGTIFFQRKDGELVPGATQVAGFKIGINPNEITDPEGDYQKLSAITTIDQDDFLTESNKKPDAYEEVGHHLSKDQADAVTALKIPGVYIYKEKWRFYPGNNLAAHTLGFVGYNGNELAGRYGLERQGQR
jgi:cell division protein FtsI/penicillin-binding protein 2